MSLELVSIFSYSEFEFCWLLASKTKFLNIANESLIFVKVNVPEKLQKKIN